MSIELSLLIIFGTINLISIGAHFYIYFSRKRSIIQQKKSIATLQEQSDNLRLEALETSQLIEQENNALRDLQEQEDALNLNIGSLQSEEAELNARIKQLDFNARTTEEMAKEAVSAIYDKAKARMETSFEESAQREAENYQEEIDKYRSDFLIIKEEFANEIKELRKQFIAERYRLDECQEKTRAAIESYKRMMLDAQQQSFYMLQIPSTDLLEIEKLRSITPYLHNPETLNKLIYKCYYEKPTTDLIGRVVGDKVSGIYKITNTKNGMCYVGQCVRFADRWRQHIKRGLGAEAQTRNKLYPAMQADGVENFMFEVIEECPPELLNEREIYWQNYFGAKEFGYSIK